MATAPTSGTYAGIYLYEVDATATAASTLLTNLLGVIDNATLTAVVDSVTLVSAVASDTTASFDAGTVTVGGTAYSDSTVVASSASAFEFTSGGSDYILANGALGETLDAFLTTLEASTTNKAVLSGLKTIKEEIDLFGFGNVTVAATSSYSTGSSYVPPCFVRGTLIATARGDVAVEDLREGDEAILAGGGTAPVIWIGRRRVDLRLQGVASTNRPVLVRAGALGEGLPVRDLRVSPDHALFLDGVLVPAGLLIDGANIVADTANSVEYFHVELPAHAVILAEGAAAESYLDTGNRSTFSNAGLVDMAPDFSVDAEAVAAAGPCAEMVLGGAALDAIRAKLAAVVLPEGLRQAS